jgi:tetratricopeptide (TPR) repeat protein
LFHRIFNYTFTKSPLFFIVEKNQFLSLIKNYTSLASEELSELISIQNKYPYSQPIHNLASRAAANSNAAAKEELLHISAIYTTDRAVLKAIMTHAKTEHVEQKLQAHSARVDTTEVAAAIEIVPAVMRVHTGATDNELLIERIFSDLENLRKSKLVYEASMDALDKLDKKNPFVDAPQPIGRKVEPEQKIEIDPADANEQILAEEILSNKKEIHTVDPKQKEQIEIIENFIKIQPGIQRPKAEAEAQSDLSEKSQHFADNVISETLVEILLKQGKKAKAIEVLKKLIWKFPQKKAYFAAQIEDLKK